MNQASVTLTCPSCGELIEGLIFQFGGFETRHHCPHCMECFSVIVTFRAVPLTPKEADILNLLDGRGHESFFDPWETDISDRLKRQGYIAEDAQGFLIRTDIGREMLSACNG